MLTGQAEIYAKSWERGTYGAATEDGLTQQETPLLETFIKNLHWYQQSRGDYVLRVLEAGAGSGDHSIRLAREGFFVDANELTEVATRRIRRRGHQLLPCSLQSRLRTVQGDITEHLGQRAAESLAGFYANSVLHTFSAEERLSLYKAVHNIQPQGGLLAISFKAQGDTVQGRGEVLEKTNAGDIVRDCLGISRLFVEDPAPLIDELLRVGYSHLGTNRWDVERYIAKKDYPDGVRKFIGFLAEKE
ncbi:class I SAM-dependent methyltransferase [Candidatus Woesearchaeota archaeon]|nr:class I SAM-dependent methyltransferase [Candidatus Woesearchaeota archaeon]